jgi:hypothetical protein
MMHRCHDCGAWNSDNCAVMRDDTGEQDCWHPYGTILVWCEVGHIRNEA